jgi:hypothetical protein
MKIVSAAFVVRIENDTEQFELIGTLDHMLDDFGFADGPMIISTAPDERDPEHLVRVAFDPKAAT